MGEARRPRHDLAGELVVDGQTIVFSTGEGDKLDAIRQRPCAHLRSRCGGAGAPGRMECLGHRSRRGDHQSSTDSPHRTAPPRTVDPLRDRVFIRLPADEIIGRRLPPSRRDHMSPQTHRHLIDILRDTVRRSAEQPRTALCCALVERQVRQPTGSPGSGVRHRGRRGRAVDAVPGRRRDHQRVEAVMGPRRRPAALARGGIAAPDERGVSV